MKQPKKDGKTKKETKGNDIRPVHAMRFIKQLAILLRRNSCASLLLMQWCGAQLEAPSDAEFLMPCQRRNHRCLSEQR
jgi:hypothetical protein